MNKDNENKNDTFKLVAMLISRRIELNMTQQQLADKAGCSQPVIGRFELCKSVPRLDTYLRIAKALNLELVLNKQKYTI